MSLNTTENEHTNGRKCRQLHTVPYARTTLDLALLSLMEHAWLLFSEMIQSPTSHPQHSYLVWFISLGRRELSSLNASSLCGCMLIKSSVHLIYRHTLDLHGTQTSELQFMLWLQCSGFSDSGTAMLTYQAVSLLYACTVHRCRNALIMLFTTTGKHRPKHKHRWTN